MDVLRKGIEAGLERFTLPGASWAVIENGEINQIGSAGLVESGGSPAVTPETLFQVASISKPVAVLAMLRLVDRGVFDLDALPTTVQILDGVRPTNTFGVRVALVPGSQFRYAGGGTMVMQQLLEDVTATPSVSWSVTWCWNHSACQTATTPSRCRQSPGESSDGARRAWSPA